MQFATRVAANHTLASPKQAKVSARLRATLSNLQAGGADFLLAAAGADFPQMSEQTRRSRFIQMLSTALKNVPVSSPAAAAPRARKAAPAASKRLRLAAKPTAAKKQ